MSVGSVRPEPNSEFDPFAGPAILETAPSTEPQREIWTAAHGGVDSSLCFNESITLRFRGSIDVEALMSSFARVVARHEALRTTFSGDGLTLCLSEPGMLPEVPVLDWSNLDAATKEERHRAVLAEEAETPFDLETGPLFRVRYARVSELEFRAILTAHHIVCDGWSTAVIVKDWAQFYNARRLGQNAELAGAEAFSVYAREQASGGHEAERAADETYWLKRFTGEIPVLELPYDRARPPVKTFAARRYDAFLPPDLVQSVKKAGAKARASLFTTLLAAFKVLLFRLSAQEDLVVGIPAAGQSAAGKDMLVGHCVNMLPLRSKLDANLPFTELLSTLRTAMLDAYDHQQYTFGTLLSKLPIPRDPSRLPLVSVVFNVDRGLTSDAMGFEDLEVECLTNPRHFENFDIFLNAVELPTGVVLECQYNTDLFDEQTLRRWLSAFGELLRGVVEDPSRAIGLLPVLSSEERATLVSFNAQTRADYPKDRCVHQLIEAQAALYPDAVACEFEGGRLTYAELNGRANRLAHRLRSLGVGRGSLVGLSVERSPEMTVGLLGILKSGAAYVPLDPGYPLDRLAFMVEDSRMTVLVTESRTLAELKLPAQAVVLLDDKDSLSQEPDSNLPQGERSSTPLDTAYVIYTSGSTGKPKGVLVPHGTTVNLLTSVQRTPGMSREDVVLAVTTLSFDIAVSELILPLTVGAKIVIVSRDVASDGQRLLDVVTSAGITFIDATPATYRLLLGAGWSGSPKLKVICTGEAMPLDLARELVDRADSVWNGYGPTETTVWSTFYQVKKPIERILIGRPVQNTQIYILDAKMQERPIGVPGEIYIAGSGVASGYLNRDDLTAERFLPDPFSNEPHARMYRTGDLGRYLKNGDLECLGRNDTQVKLRGYRIELGEIENALGQHPLVRQCAVIVREDRPGDRRLTAYVVVHPGASVKDADLRAHLKSTLPDYMVPAAYVHLDTMPLTPSGKINRKALPAPDATAAVTDAEFVPPRTATEKLIAELWQEALSVPRVSIRDDFFALGGHSLLASQVLARLRRDHGIQLSFRKIFEAPTIEQLAVLVGGDSGTPEASPEADRLIERRSDPSPAPLSTSQERLWLLEEMDPSERLVHALPAAWRFEGKVNAELLQRALDEIARRHETLRTTIGLVSGKPVQIVAPSVDLPIARVDLSDQPAETREAALAENIARQTREIFDLGKGPLFRSCLFRLAENEFVYHTVRHNIIWDGWSFDVFLRELTTLYGALENGTKPALPELPIAYSDYVAWHRRYLEGPEIARQIAWWQAELAREPRELTLPSDRPRPTRTEHAGSNLIAHFSRADADALTALGRSSNATLFMVVFAAFVTTLHRYSGQTDILVGTPVRARNRPEVENLLGPFINAVVLRTKIDPEMTFSELLRNVRDKTLDSFSNQDMPLERLGSRPPVIRSFFSFQDARTRPPSLGTIPVSQMHVEPPAAANDLMLWMMETRSELLAVVNYSTELFDAETMQRFLSAFGTLLKAVVENPNQRVGELRLASPAELSRTRDVGTPAGTFGPSVTERIALVSKAHGARTAVRAGAGTLAYDQLVGRTAGVARLLAAKGLGPGKLVALYASSPVDRVVGVLGAMTAGTTFVVLDPAFPLLRNRALMGHLRPDAVLAGDGLEVPPDLAPEVVLLREAQLDGATPNAASNLPATHPAALVCHFDARGNAVSYPVSLGTLSEGAAQIAAIAEMSAGQIVAGLSMPSAPLSTFEILAPLSVGAELLLPGAQQRLDRLSVERPLDSVMGPPAVFSRMSQGELATLRAAVILGEPSQSLCEALLGAGKSAFRIEAYPEGGLAPFVTRITKSAEHRCIGQPVFPLRAHIVGRNQEPLPRGVPGELNVTTAAVATWTGPGAAQTGVATALARARIRGNDVVELIEHDPRLVELQGHRFELSEIASILERHASIASAFVQLSAPSVGVPKLAAYLVTRPGASYTETELRKHLQSLLPDFMVPQIFVEVDAIPMSDSGQVDISRLPSPFAKDEGAEYVAPRSDTERLLSELFAKALGVSRVGVYDNFFDLGGQSLLCFEVIGNIEQRTGRRISPRIMLLGSLEQVAVEIDGGKKAITANRSPAEAPRAPALTPARVPEDAGGGLLAGRLFKKLKGLMKGS